MAALHTPGPVFGGGACTFTVNTDNLTGLFTGISWTNAGGEGSITVGTLLLGTATHTFNAGESGSFIFLQPLDLLTDGSTLAINWSAE